MEISTVNVPVDVMQEISDWFDSCDFTILHVWEVDQVYLFVIQLEYNNLHFIRVFKNIFTGIYSLSQDNKRVLDIQ